MPAAPHSDTIVAIATPAGRGGVGVVRVSGAAVQTIAQQLLQRTLTPRHAQFSPFFGADANVLDEGIALWFPAPHSYTGEDTLELQGHGSPLVLAAIVRRCIEAGAPHTRHAAPGEFTQRAFLNDKLDLAQAEAVADLIDANTQAAARAALNSLTGTFSAHITTLQNQLIRLRTFTEATLDFPEEDVDFLQAENAKGQGLAVRAALDAVLAQAKQGQLLHDGIRVVLIGAPNVGKSSLLNRLAGDELAIVTPIPGTTRDTVRARISLNGLPCEVIDTAGLRETEDRVEQIGIERTWAAIATADIALILHDASMAADDNTAHAAVLRRLPPELARIEVWNKSDLLATPINEVSERLQVSAVTGAGIDALIARVSEAVGYHAPDAGTFTARGRHLDALRRARQHLDQALAQLELPALELFAEELRAAHRALGDIVGTFTADDLLGEIFGKFCIGK
jgi:tRNA modification GTPase